MLIPSLNLWNDTGVSSLSRRVNANSQLTDNGLCSTPKLIKKGEC